MTVTFAVGSVFERVRAPANLDAVIVIADLIKESLRAIVCNASCDLLQVILRAEIRLMLLRRVPQL